MCNYFQTDKMQYNYSLFNTYPILLCTCYLPDTIPSSKIREMDYIRYFLSWSSNSYQTININKWELIETDECQEQIKFWWHMKVNCRDKAGVFRLNGHQWSNDSQWWGSLWEEHYILKHTHAHTCTQMHRCPHNMNCTEDSSDKNNLRMFKAQKEKKKLVWLHPGKGGRDV